MNKQQEESRAIAVAEKSKGSDVFKGPKNTTLSRTPGMCSDTKCSENEHAAVRSLKGK